MRAAKFSVPSLLRTHTPAAFGPGDGQTLTVRVLVPTPRFLQRGSHPEFRRTAFVFSWCFFVASMCEGKRSRMSMNHCCSCSCFVFLKNIFVLVALKSLVTGFQHLRDGQILTGAFWSILCAPPSRSGLGVSGIRDCS